MKGFKCGLAACAVWLLFGGLSSAMAANDGKRNITEHDLFNFQWIGDPQLSASGSEVAYVAVTVDEKALALAPRRADLEKEAAAIYAKVFTVEEMDAITAFYTSPAGLKLLKDGPIAIRELSQAGDIWATGISRDMAKQSDDSLEAQIGEMEKKAQ